MKVSQRCPKCVNENRNCEIRFLISCCNYGAEDENRTRTPVSRPRILSPISTFTFSFFNSGISKSYPQFTSIFDVGFHGPVKVLFRGLTVPMVSPISVRGAA